MAYLAAALINLALIALTAFAYYHTGSLWTILILFFMISVRNKEANSSD